jgi:WD40-like Beta Propeller Repeat
VSSSLRSRLEGAPLPDGDAAQARAWGVVADAFDGRPPASAPARFRRRGRVLGLALAVALLAAAVAVAAQPPHWVRHVLGAGHAAAPPARTTLGPLPAGRMLVSSRDGTWIVRGDGTRQRLGPWTAATWSPRGLYVAAWRGRSLSAVAPNGRVAWTIIARGTVHDATWSPDGYRIAYRRDDVLAVVAGDGTGARVFAAPVRPVAPAWRPGAPHTLAWINGRGQVEVRDVDTGALVWRSAAAVRGVRALAWSPNGERLLAHGPHHAVVLDVHDNRVWGGSIRHGVALADAAWSPRGDRIAYLLRSRTRTTVIVARSARLPYRGVFSTTGTLGSLAWSPDGRRLLVRWSEADQWLLVSPTSPSAHVTAIGAISRRFGTAPTVQDWCCSR